MWVCEGRARSIWCRISTNILETSWKSTELESAVNIPRRRLAVSQEALAATALKLVWDVWEEGRRGWHGGGWGNKQVTSGSSPSGGGGGVYFSWLWLELFMRGVCDASDDDTFLGCWR